jgi:hypothetical protein
MSDLVIVRLSELERAHTPLLNDLLHISRGDKDYHILYSDYVDNILANLDIQENVAKWNASQLSGIPITLSGISNQDVIIYNSSINSFVNRKLTKDDIEYTGLGTINGDSYLKVVSGQLVNSRVRVQDLQPSGITGAGKFLRVSSDGTTIIEDDIVPPNNITTNTITNITNSPSVLGSVDSSTVERPVGGVGYAYIAKSQSGNSASVIFVDTNTSATKVRTHNGGANPNAFDQYYDIYNSKTNPLSSSISSTSTTNIANSNAVKLLNDKVDLVQSNLTQSDSNLTTHKSSNDHDERYYNKAYMDLNFAKLSDISDASILISGKLNNDRLNTTITSNTTGNAATATKLLNDRRINGQIFNGSNDIVTEPYIDRDDSSNSNRYLTFVNNNTQTYQGLRVDNDLKYNPSTNTISANISGSASTFANKDINNFGIYLGTLPGQTGRNINQFMEWLVIIGATSTTYTYFKVELSFVNTNAIFSVPYVNGTKTIYLQDALVEVFSSGGGTSSSGIYMVRISSPTSNDGIPYIITRDFMGNYRATACGLSPDRYSSSGSHTLFASLSSSEGNQRFPSGIIFQWGSVNVSANSYVDITLPISITSQYQVYASNTNIGFQETTISADFIGGVANKIRVGNYKTGDNDGSNPSRGARWLVIGKI